MSIATKKVNNVKVRQIPREGEEDKRPIKGYDLCCHLYGNIYLVAKKNSGKTTVIYSILDRCSGRDTIVIAFVSTLNNDANWLAIKTMCEDKGMPFLGYTSLMDEEGNDQLQALMRSMQDKATEDEEDQKAESKELKKHAFSEPVHSPLPCMRPPDEKALKKHAFSEAEAKTEETKKQRRTAYRAPEMIVILDDLADELKKKSVATLLKKNRHFKSKVIISSQWLNDIPPAALGQMSMFCLFRGFSVEKLTEFHDKARLTIPVEKFIALYTDATSKDFGFLCIDTDHGTYRRRFAEQYII